MKVTIRFEVLNKVMGLISFLLMGMLQVLLEAVPQSVVHRQPFAPLAPAYRNA